MSKLVGKVSCIKTLVFYTPIPIATIPTPMGRSWSALFSSQSANMDSCVLDLSVIFIQGGSISISALKEGLEDNLAYWKHSLVGYFIGA